MRLDTELSSPSTEHGVVADAVVANYDREANEALREGVQAAQAGDRAKARTALLRATEIDPSSESAWLWLASISEYPEELLVFLNNVLDINPHNARATEWMSATKSLLAKTFVQRGVDAANGGQAGFAAQCFNQALENDQSNADAWLGLAKLAESAEGKVSYLEKVVELDPDNAEASAELADAKDSINQALLGEARAAAVSGRKGDANDLLDAFIAENPESEDGWILRSLLADAFEEKVAAFEKVLQINPNNPVAASGLESLRSIMALVSPREAVQPATAVDAMENTAFAINSERNAEAVHDKSPTQELEFPVAAAELHELKMSELSAAQPEESVEVFENVSSSQEPPDSGMKTVAFSFAFPAGDMDSENAHEAKETSDQYEGSPDPGNVSSNVPDQDDALYETAHYEPVPSPSDLAEPFAAVPVPSKAFTDAEAAHSDPAYTLVDEYVVVREATDAETIEVPVENVSVGSAESAIPMPLDFTVPAALAATGYETRIVRPEPAAAPAAAAACPFCRTENPSQAFTCGQCLTTLTLSDLETMLANSHADRAILRDAVKEMESTRESRPLDEKELTNMGIAHLNLRDFNAGYQYLHEASSLNPNNVVLASQVNSLLIRLEEIKRQEEAAGAMPRERKILVVDDSPTVRKLIAGKLEKCGHEVYCAADGVEAIEQLDTVIPDLVLLDITMPRMDGYQVCKVIRGRESTKDIPVVMISGKDGFFDKVRGRMAGTTGYITKPFGPETLMKAVETYLKGVEV
jgi:CheY-like chemotaxis protein